MADEILYQGPGYTIARSSKAMCAVPYGPVNRENGDSNYGFLDIRDKPELVTKIPEAAKSPGLANLLRVINELDSPVMSLGCECGYFLETSVDADLAGYIGSYVGVTFRDPDRNNDPDGLVTLACSILHKIKPCETHSISFEMVVAPLKHFFGLSNRFELAINCIGRGVDESDAWDAFAVATNAVASAFREMLDERLARLASARG